MNKTRRRFMRDAARFSMGLGVVSINPALVKAMKRKVSANEKIGLALIGARGRGYGVLKQALKQSETECLAICDIDDQVIENRNGELSELQDRKPKVFKDFRRLLDEKDIDAVIVGTPDHWHCLQMVYACQANKDVYVEKPVANSLAELELMVKATRNHQRIVQVGQQQRSGNHWKTAINYIKAGKIGQLRKINIWANFNYGVGQVAVPDTPVPDGVDFDMWLGPAPTRSFNPARFHGSWRMFWDYGGGLMTDWGVHLIDVALWAADITTTPQAVVATGGRFSHPERAHETFDNMSVNYQLDGLTITLESLAGIQTGPYGKSYGLAFVGNAGTLVIDRAGWDVYPELENDKPKTTVMSDQSSRTSSEDHVKNFLDCIKSRKEPACPVETGKLAALYCHMGNIALRTQSRLVWDQQNKKFLKNKKANAVITPQYRKPWSLPKY